MEPHSSDFSRRSFLKTAGTAAAVSSLPLISHANVAGSSELKVAVIGCGGRGTGATNQTLQVEGTKLVAMADAFADNIESSYLNLKNAHGDKVDVPAERRFVGFDAYRHAIDLADVVILTTPPGFRPQHFEYAVAQGKHVFMEKPVATDAAGIRKVLAAARAADEKKLKVVCGLQRRYQSNYVQTHEEVMGGKIGDVVAAQVYWNSAGVWVRDRKEGMSEMEYQMRNWYYFTWLCGENICEQHVHNIDVANWFMGAAPQKAQGMGGRQTRIGPDFGEAFDHHFVEFNYQNGAYTNSQCRHQKGTLNRVTEVIVGSRGTATAGRILDMDGKTIWKASKPKEGEEANPYQVEHNELYRHIREDLPKNDAYYTAESTMTAILGRMATYSGTEMKWDEAIASKVSITPKEFGWDKDPGPKPGKDGLYPCAMPGVTKVV